MSRCPTEQRKDIRAVDGSGELVRRTREWTAASHTMLHAMSGAIEGPRKLVWKQEFSSNRQDPDSITSHMMGRRVNALMAKYEAAEALRTDRDPCPKCGVRRDVGCKHTGGRA